MAQGQSDVKPKFEAEFKVKIEPVEEFNRNMEIITNMSVPAKTIEVPNKTSKIEMDVKPKIETKLKVETDVKIKTEPVEEFDRNMEIIANMSIPAKTIEVPSKKSKIEMDVKPKIEKNLKVETDIKIKTESIEEFNRSIEIITKMDVPTNVEIKKEKIEPKMEMDVKPKIETDIKIKTESIEEFNRSMEIVTKMNVPTNVEIKNEKIEQKMEMDVKPKIKTDFKAKIEPIEDINRAMGIVGNMNIPIKAEIKDDWYKSFVPPKIEVPYKKAKIEMDVKPKIEADFQAKSEPIDGVNRRMEIIGNMDIIPIKAKIQTKNYKCFICKLVEFSDENLLMQHLSTSHTVHIEIMFEKAHKSCGGPFRRETKSLSKLSIWDKVFHVINCSRKIEPIGEINKGNDVHASVSCIFCIKKDIPSKKGLIRHLTFAHMKDIEEATKCYNCNVPFLGTFLNLKISHFIDCYSFGETKTYCNSTQKKPDVKAKINSEKLDCSICSQKNFPTNQSLIQHLSSVHWKNVKRMERCGNCTISFGGSKHIKGMANRYSLPIPERISHLMNCYQKKENKTKVDCNPIQKKPVDRFKYICVFCPKMTFLSQHNIFSHITLKCEGPKHGSENQDCRKIYDCTLCGVLKNVTLHRLMQHTVEFHQKDLELKQQCSKCFEFDGKTSVYEKIKHIVFGHLCQCSVCRLCKRNRTASIKGGLCLNSQIRDTTN